MKYYCEECGKIYDTEDEVRECEFEHSESKKVAEEKAAQKETRWKEVLEAEKKYKKLYREYLNDYGARVKKVNYYPHLDLFSDDLFSEIF